jgi:hypothetical protein
MTLSEPRHAGACARFNKLRLFAFIFVLRSWQCWCSGCPRKRVELMGETARHWARLDFKVGSAAGSQSSSQANTPP